MRRGLVLVSFCAAVAVAVPAYAQSAGDFRWAGTIQPGNTVEIKGVNGFIHAEPAPGGQVEVTAQKHARRSDPNSVTVQVVQNNGSVTICAVYPPAPPGLFRRGDNQPNECRPGDAGHMSTNDNDVVVDFTVRVPAGVRFVGKTVNGAIDARGLQSDGELKTVNGQINLTTSGIASAETVNGSISVTLGTAVWTRPLEFTTVNGSLTVAFPPGIDAQLRADTVNGTFSSDFPVTIQSSGNRGRRIVGTIGNGGRELALRTVNGSIRLKSAQ